MDTTKSERENELTKEKERIRQLFAKKEIPLMQEERKQANEVLKCQLEEIDKLINSDEISATYKGSLKLFKVTLQMHFSNLNTIFNAIEFANNLHTAHSKAIQLILEKLSMYNKDTDELKNTIQTIQADLDEKKITEITRIMTKIEKQIEQSNKASEVYRV